MKKWLQSLMLALALGVAFPASAAIITGADGPLAPAADTILPYRADGIFDFSSIDIGAGITLRFDAGMSNVTLLSLGDILIAGTIDAPGINLALETPGQIVLSGSVTADGISLTAGSISLTGDLRVGGGGGGNSCLKDCGPFKPPRRGIAIPEPGTPWLMALLLPMLALFGRKRGQG